MTLLSLTSSGPAADGATDDEATDVDDAEQVGTICYLVYNANKYVSPDAVSSCGTDGDRACSTW